MAHRRQSTGGRYEWPYFYALKLPLIFDRENSRSDFKSGRLLLCGAVFFACEYALFYTDCGKAFIEIRIGGEAGLEYDFRPWV